jgi:hypothetical protein
LPDSRSALRNATSGAYSDLIWAGNSMFAWVAGTQTTLPTYRLLDHIGSLAMTRMDRAM